jgi:aspartate/methionine/tyrosine aminotransferase
MTGWRLGWAVVPESLIGAMRDSPGNCSWCRRPFRSTSRSRRWTSQAELEAHVATYARNRELLTEALAGFGIRRIAPPDGAFYLYADMGDVTRDSLSFCRELLDATGVALNTGRDFDAAHGDRFVRSSFAVSTPEVLRAIESLDAFLRQRKRA